jgi:PAS domain S-box-containing protein
MPQNSSSVVENSACRANPIFESKKQPSLQQLLDSSLDVICTIDAEGRFEYVSAASKDVWGYEPAELIGVRYMDYVVPEDHPKTVAVAEAITSGINITTFENRYTRKDGSIVWILWSARWNEGDALMYCVAKDLTEKKEAEQKEKEKLADIYDSIQDCYFSVTKDFTITQWNKKIAIVLGKRKEDVMGKNLWDEYPEATSLKFFSQYNNALNANVSVHFEECLPSTNGWYEVSAYPNGNGLDIYFQDIKARKEQELSLKLAIERYKFAALATNDVLWDWDLPSNKCYFNDAFTLLFGHENNEDVIYRNWLDNIHEDDILRVFSSIQEALDNPSIASWEAEYKFYKADRTIAYILDRGTIIRNRLGAAQRMVGSIQDISKIKETTEELERLSLVAKETINAVLITDAEERITWVNKAFTDISEYSFDEAIGRKPNELLQGEKTSRETKAYLRKCIEDKVSFNCEIINYSKSGREYWMEIKGQPIFDDQGKIRQFIAIQTDITHRKELELQVIADKIAAQKEVSRAIMSTQEKERSEMGKELHDNVCQLLTTSKLYFENIKYLPNRKDEFADKGMAILQQSIDEIRVLSKQLVTPVMNDIGFAATIQELTTHYNSLNVFEILFHHELQEELIDKDLKLAIYRILQELFNNTVKYANATAVVFKVVNIKNKVMLQYKDNGIGFDSSIVKNGIGLKNIQNRASIYRGIVSIKSAVGSGCEVDITFPVL